MVGCRESNKVKKQLSNNYMELVEEEIEQTIKNKNNNNLRVKQKNVNLTFLFDIVKFPNRCKTHLTCLVSDSTH